MTAPYYQKEAFLIFLQDFKRLTMALKLMSQIQRQVQEGQLPEPLFIVGHGIY